MLRATALVDYLLDGVEDPLADEMAGWLADSGHFRGFVQANRDKIRKKLRGATDADARRDVQLELKVAQRLLADHRIDVAFEAYGSTKGGPDFTVTFRGERAFNLEVTRMRRLSGAGTDATPILGKLRQLPPSVPNAVLLAFDGIRGEAFDVAAATRALRARADAKDEAYFTGRGFDGTRGFYRRYLRLGAVLVWCDGAIGDDRVNLWRNRSARITVPDRAIRACVACLRARLD